MTISAILEKRDGAVVTIGRGTIVRDAVAMLAERRIGALPVVDGGEVVGVMSERDVIYHLAESGADILDWPVERIMSAPAITVDLDRSIMSALSLMTNRRIRHLPVVTDSGLTGIVSIGDLVKFRLDQIETEAEAMLAYIQTA
jgi:CBS domain-containing protein